jgi:spore maturation protein CgeB
LDLQAVSPSLVLHLTDDFLPPDLERAPVPTACLFADVFVGLASRVRWSMLFDYVFVAHPQFINSFRMAGHPNVYSMPLAAPSAFLMEPEGDAHRPFDVGWVGRSQGSLFTARARILQQLAGKFQMNEWWRWHSYEETAQVFRHSKVVLNISRDDYPKDANMRVFEAMAAEALLITRLPTELSELGFREGEHFVGYRDEADLEKIIRAYLARHKDRLEIARRGSELVRRGHTYEHRAQKIFETIEQNGARFFAPARTWPISEVRLAYLQFQCSNQSFQLAARTMGELLRSGGACSVRGFPMFAKALARRVRTALR